MTASPRTLRAVCLSVDQVRNSKRFSTLLVDVVLPLGNKLNQGNRKLTATLGVKLTALSEMVRMKAIDGETFLQFVINGLLEKAPQVPRIVLVVGVVPVSDI